MNPLWPFDDPASASGAQNNSPSDDFANMLVQDSQYRFHQQNQYINQTNFTTHNNQGIFESGGTSGYPNNSGYGGYKLQNDYVPYTVPPGYKNQVTNEQHHPNNIPFTDPFQHSHNPYEWDNYNGNSSFDGHYVHEEGSFAPDDNVMEDDQYRNWVFQDTVRGDQQMFFFIFQDMENLNAQSSECSSGTKIPTSYWDEENIAFFINCMHREVLWGKRKGDILPNKDWRELQFEMSVCAPRQLQRPVPFSDLQVWATRLKSLFRRARIVKDNHIG